jgi:hypothetical protein
MDHGSKQMAEPVAGVRSEFPMHFPQEPMIAAIGQKTGQVHGVL